MQLITVDLTNNISGLVFSYTVQVNNWTQFYSRLNTIMYGLAHIEQVSPANISHHIIENKLIAA